MTMHNVRSMFPNAQTGAIDGGGGGGDDKNMELEKRVTAIETTLPTLMTKADGEALRADLHKLDASIKTWMIGTIIGLFVGFAGLFFTMSNSLKPSAHSATALPPVIINVPGVQQSAPTAPQQPEPQKPAQ
ncbi:hypothetical protein [Burkholderia territorii]|uniref:hypothetical protein n=1 Tax=Burkholderia territorii TaxID=1503055 RepID=UPI000754CC0D|nr:hypothetical protein [Burkholderia territorii]KWA08351.1 hypothetical protein WT37_25640 [Burkholderia territorii]